MINKQRMEDFEVWYSEYELRQFIDMAIRWGIDGVYESRTKDNPYSVFEFYVRNARNNFDLFCFQINDKLNKNQYWKAIEIDLKDRFFPMIICYKEWYNKNKVETEKFEPYNPYKYMLSFIESTQEEILKYFPESIPPEQKSNNLKLSLPQIALIHIYNEISINAYNAAEIAKNYGYASKTSGIKLNQFRIKYQHTADRKGAPRDPTYSKMKNKIKLFESILPFLKEDGLRRAKAEIEILKNIPQTEYL
jgi:hypothetical protein